MTTLAEDIAALMALGHNLERATELAQADRAQADHARGKNVFFPLSVSFITF